MSDDMAGFTDDQLIEHINLVIGTLRELELEAHERGYSTNGEDYMSIELRERLDYYVSIAKLRGLALTEWVID